MRKKKTVKAARIRDLTGIFPGIAIIDFHCTGRGIDLDIEKKTQLML